jgi:hypothetical protein
MLRLVFLAGISLLSGCSCEALWGRYEVPCTRGFDCPEGMTPGGHIDLRGTGSSEDGGTGSDGSTTTGDMRGVDMALPMPDMRPDGPDGSTMDMRTMLEVELGLGR